MDSRSARMHNQCGPCETGRSMHPVQKVLSAGISYTVTFASSALPPLLLTHPNWKKIPSLGKVCPGQARSQARSQARTVFDMHSSHNLVASFSSQAMSSGLTFDPGHGPPKACVSASLLIKELGVLHPQINKATTSLLEIIPNLVSQQLQQFRRFSFSREKKNKTMKERWALPKELPGEVMVTGYLMTTRLSPVSGM